MGAKGKKKKKGKKKERHRGRYWIESPTLSSLAALALAPSCRSPQVIEREGRGRGKKERGGGGESSPLIVLQRGAESTLIE